MKKTIKHFCQGVYKQTVCVVQKMERLKIYIAIVVLTTSLFVCQSVDLNQLKKDVDTAAVEAEKLQKQGKWQEAAVFLRAVQTIEPNHAQANTIAENFTATQQAALKSRQLLGINKALRPERPASDTRVMIRWFPDRFRDLADCVTIGAGIGPQIGYTLHATKALGFGVYAGNNNAIGSYQKNLLAASYDNHVELSLSVLGYKNRSAKRWGTGGNQTGATEGAIFKPDQSLYQEYEDFFGVGGKIGYFFFGFELVAHPIEVADFTLGLFGIDFLEDDDLDRQDLRFSKNQKKILKRVSGLAGDDIRRYQKKYNPKNGNRL